MMAQCDDGMRRVAEVRGTLNGGYRVAVHVECDGASGQGHYVWHYSGPIHGSYADAETFAAGVLPRPCVSGIRWGEPIAVG